MKLTNIVFCLLLLSGFTAAAQRDNLPPALDIVSDTATYIHVPAHNIQYLREKDGKPLKLAEVIIPGYNSQFRAISESKPVIIPADKYVWMRYRIRNSMSEPLGITIPQAVSHAEIYISGPAGKWSHYTTGHGIPHSKRDGYKRINEVGHTIPPRSEIIIYERNSDNFSGIQLSVMVGIEKNVVAQSYIDNDLFILGLIWSCVLFGFFIFAAIFNFFFYYTVREKVYLVYGILLVFIAVSYVSPALTLFVLKEFPGYGIYDSFIGFGLTFYFFSIVSLMFLQVSKYHPVAYRVLIGCSTAFIVLCSIMFIFSIARNETVLLIIRILRYVMIGGILLVMVADLVKKRHFARMFMLASLPFIIVFTIQLLTDGLNIRMLFDGTVLWAAVVLSWSLFARYKYLQAENARQAVEKEQERNALIAQQNEMLERQVAERTSELTRSLADLKQTQSQLIQSEKMASLGELTAGIAHEIQNPLNFVNNFSDVSVELLQELKEELGKGDIDEASAIADDVTQNLEKIAHHGRRADGIVKGMLQHSRASSGQKETTDINLLADEYLRLAYHGLRAKDKSFNAELITNFDESLPKANVIPQDIGRVLLNLFTNAFYATQQKSKQMGDSSYQPSVEVATKQNEGTIEIVVKDNGTGIPDVIKDKILQPFFTTKPTGEGTGLGLSLSYDIVVKGHGGKIDIESKEGEGSEFKITLPV